MTADHAELFALWESLICFTGGVRTEPLRKHLELPVEEGATPLIGTRGSSSTRFRAMVSSASAYKVREQ